MAPSAQLLPLIPLRPDLRRLSTGRTRTSGRESVEAARDRQAGAGPHAGRGPHARLHDAAVSSGGGWGARGRAEGARGEGRAEFDSRRAYGTHSNICSNPSTSHPCTSPPCMSTGRRLHVGWCRCPARLWYSGLAAAILDRRGMVGGTAVINHSFQPR
jgi:hypothetical protein